MKLIRIIPNRKRAEPIQGRALFPIDAKRSGGFDTIRDADGCIVDYQNVRFAGYLSTFSNVTPADRDGDSVKRGAFKDSLPEYLRNPILLSDHVNRTANLCGRVVRAFEDDKGLFIEGEISNGQSDFLKQVRALVAEGSLRTLSMGGMFYYEADGKTIYRVDLYEATLTPIPANQDAIFNVL